MGQEKLGEVLVRLGHAARHEVEAAVQDQRARGGAPRLGEILVERGSCDEEGVARAVAVQAGLKYCQISKFRVPSQTIAKVPRDVAEDAGIFPLKEYADGQVVHTKVPRPRLPVEEYLERQGRFRHLFEPRRDDAAIREIQARVDAYWAGIS